MLLLRGRHHVTPCECEVDPEGVAYIQVGAKPRHLDIDNDATLKGWDKTRLTSSTCNTPESPQEHLQKYAFPDGTTIDIATTALPCGENRKE